MQIADCRMRNEKETAMLPRIPLEGGRGRKLYRSKLGGRGARPVRSRGNGTPHSTLRNPQSASLLRRSGSGCEGWIRSCLALSLLELMVALVLLGLLLALSLPALDGITAGWRLRAAAHQVEAVVQWAQNAAAVTGGPVQVLYDVPDGSFWVRMNDETHAHHRLPDGVSFESVRFGEVEVIYDVAAVRAFPDGTVDAHEVRLQTGEDTLIGLTFNRLTGEVQFREGTDVSP